MNKYPPQTKKKVLKYYTIRYVKKLVKQTLENLRKSVVKLPQKGKEDKEEQEHEQYISTHHRLPESPLLGCTPQQTSVPAAYGINRSCQHFGHL